MRVCFIISLLVFLLSCRSAANRYELEYGGRAREYLVLPVEQPRSMTFVLHGGGGKAAHMIRLAEGLPEIAKQKHILLVYPQGIDKGWNDGRDTKISTAISENIDDAGFLDSLALKLAADYKIPEDKIFITGISNGGMMSQRLACESRAFRAIASVAANLQESFAPKCKPSAPISTLFILGTEDPLVPYGGGDITLFKKTRGRVLSADATLQFWRSRNQCNADSVKTDVPDTTRDNTSATVETWSCGNARVRLIRVLGGGHTWPGGLQYLPEVVVGRTSRDFSASEEIVRFFLGD